MDIEASLTQIANRLISECTCPESPIREGHVATGGTATYRRLDCDGRALAYVRTRAKKKIVRIDVSGLWRVPAAHPTTIRTGSGALAFTLRSEREIGFAVEYLRAIIDHTRNEAPLADGC